MNAILQNLKTICIGRNNDARKLFWRSRELNIGISILQNLTTFCIGSSSHTNTNDVFVRPFEKTGRIMVAQCNSFFFNI